MRLAILDSHDFPCWIAMKNASQLHLLVGATRYYVIIDLYIKTLAQVVGCEDSAISRICSVSTIEGFGFGASIFAELAVKLKGVPGVNLIMPDYHIDALKVCNGLSLRVPQLREMILDHTLDIVFLSGTKHCSSYVDIECRKLCFDYMFVVDSVGLAGGDEALIQAAGGGGGGGGGGRWKAVPRHPSLLLVDTTSPFCAFFRLAATLSINVDLHRQCFLWEIESREVLRSWRTIMG
ncbi:hypothetical protein ACH5RR_018750 [Cinchona calisaya]|uniref:MORF/ORRM1/DAG-like MORF domain-containing protein n=1 Tax=Cinchona calisaya TaxID=153742 RepID=A0ABD2ZP07_9GENT